MLFHLHSQLSWPFIYPFHDLPWAQTSYRALIKCQVLPNPYLNQFSMILTIFVSSLTPLQDPRNNISAAYSYSSHHFISSCSLHIEFFPIISARLSLSIDLESPIKTWSDEILMSPINRRPIYQNLSSHFPSSSRHITSHYITLHNITN